MTCTLAGVANQSSLDLMTDLLPLAQQVNGAISADTVMWIQAWGGKGGKGAEEFGGWTGGWGGDGGFAQTTTTINDYQTIFDTSQLYYYLANKGGDNTTAWGAGGGAASTIVASVGSGFSASNVVLIAGGGGGGNYAQNFSDGQNGGHGGSAIATTANSTYGAAQSLSGDGGTVRGGSYSGPGKGSPSINDPTGSLESGGDGFGGFGGGGYSHFGWMNGDAGTASSGSGIRSSGSPGSPSGGGYGGGGMNVCGGALGGAHNCAGPGGGSYAAGITQLDGFAPTQYIADTGASMIKLVFNLQPVTYSFSGPYTGVYNLPPGVSAPASPVFVDIDNDGDQDLFLGIESVPSSPFDTGRVATPVFYLKNHGTATNPEFGTVAQNPFGLQSVANGGTPAFADIDNDGDFDAFIGNGVGTTVYFENTGTSTNPSFASGIVNAFGLSTLGTSANLTAGTAWVAPTFADIDNDGDLDAFIGADDGHVYYFPNNGSKTSPQFGSAQASAFGISAIGDTYAKPAFFDVEGDGDLDLFIGAGHGSTGFYQNTGTASAPQFLPSADTDPAAVNLFGLTNVGGNAAPTFADLNGDGTTDALLGSSSGGLWFYPSMAWSDTALAGIDSEPVPSLRDDARDNDPRVGRRPADHRHHLWQRALRCQSGAPRHPLLRRLAGNAAGECPHGVLGVSTR